MSWGLITAARSLRRAPGFAATAVLTVAIGVGAAVGVFTVLDSLWLRPLPYPDPARLMGVWTSLPGMHVERAPQSLATYFTFRRYARALDGIGLFQRASVGLSDSSGRAAPERLRAALVTASLLPMLGARLQLGRGFSEAEDAPRGDPVVLIGDGLWRRRFGADPRIVGAHVEVDGRAHQIIGVLAPTFQFPDDRTEVWLPLALDPEAPFVGPFQYGALARLRPGVTRAAAEADLNAVLPRAAELFPQLTPGMSTAAAMERLGARTFLRPMREDVIGSLAGVLRLAASAALLLLLISGANVVSLLAARAESRRVEMAVRAALGASPRQTFLRAFGEVLILALAGGACGVGLADAGLRAVVRSAASRIPQLSAVRPGTPDLVFAAGLTLLVAVLCALVLARRRDFRDLAALRDTARGSTAGKLRRHARRALVVAQVTLAAVLVTAAMLLTRTAGRLRAVRAGFDGTPVLTLWISLPKATYPADRDVVRFTEGLLDRLGALAGVQSVGVTSKLPLNPLGSAYTPIWGDNDVEPGGALPPSQQITTVAGDYFAALRIPLLAGRPFARSGIQQAYEVIVDRTLATRYWGDSTGQRALGRQVRFTPSGGQAYTVVGVVGSVRDSSLASPPTGAVYMPDVLAPDSNLTAVARTLGVAVRVAGDPAAVAGAVREVLRGIDSSLPAFDVVPMAGVVQQSLAPLSFVVLLIGVTAAGALILAAVGLYGVLAYMVRLDVRGIGIRMALGASPARVAGSVAADAGRLAAAGLAIGAALCVALAKLARATIPGLSFADPWAMAGVAGILLLVALGASGVPAWRATHVDPARTLTNE